MNNEKDNLGIESDYQQDELENEDNETSDDDVYISNDEELDNPKFKVKTRGRRENDDLINSTSTLLFDQMTKPYKTNKHYMYK